MRRIMKLVTVVAVLGIVAAACAGDGEPQVTPTGTTPTGIQPGGTLKFAQLADVISAFDPQKEYYSVTWEYYRCCLLRTMMSYNGHPTEEGGTAIHADLAAADPQVSSDGLTWTFSIKQGIFYAPPKQDVQITAGDFIRALERAANPKANVGGYSFYYSAIEGFDDFADDKADSISGLSAPDEFTLEVKVTQPTGDLGYRFAMAMTAPIPPDEDGERLGVADGHDKDYGRFLVASGPYMFEGSENLDFSLPAGDQKPVAGYVPNRSIVLVRNPSWSPDSDELRPAYPDRIEVTIGGDNDVLYDQVATGELDFVVDGAVPPEKIQEYTTNPELQDRFHRFPSDVVRYISMNLALPPFDDLHVRKAFNYALNKAGMRQVRGGPDTGIFAGHIMVDSLQNNLLAEYDPYATPNSEGDLDLAAAEMAMSKYDSNGDGVCDDPSCKDILSVTDREDPYPDQTAIIRENLEPLGITLDVKDLERGTMYNKCLDLNEKVPLCLGPGWGKDYADGYTFGPPLFGSEAIFPSCCNYALVGASPETLAEAGYDITEVPSVDPDMAECAAQTEPDARFQCWADVDKKLMEEVVPWVPYLFDNALDIVSDRIVNYSFDQFAGLAAFDQMAIDPALQ